MGNKEKEVNVNKTSGIFAYYIGDFRFPDLTFGSMRFYYNPDTRHFTLAIDADVTYDAETVIEDSDFLLFQEYLDSDGDLCIIQLEGSDYLADYGKDEIENMEIVNVEEVAE